jgi:hypothetical protein
MAVVQFEEWLGVSAGYIGREALGGFGILQFPLMVSFRKRRHRRALDSGSLVLESAATSSSIEREVGLVDTQLAFTEPGHQRLHAEKRGCNSVGSLGVMIPSKIASSITKRSL